MEDYVKPTPRPWWKVNVAEYVNTTIGLGLYACGTTLCWWLVLTQAYHQ